MNIVNVEICSLIFIFILFFDYYNRFKYRFNKASYLLLMSLIGMAILSLLNILLAKLNMLLVIKYLMIVLGFYIIFVLPALFYAYVQENFLCSPWYFKVKKYLKIFYLLFIPACIFLTIINYPNILELPNSIPEYFYYNELLLISLIPICLLLIEYAFRYYINKEKRELKIFIIILIGFSGLLLEVFTKYYYLLTPIYVAIALLLYQYKNEVMNTKDVLTGLYNREILHKIQTVRRNDDRKLVIYMIDVNKFKYINDTYGHHKGDKILKDIAMLLYDTVRGTDYVIRFGGDEFIIIANMSDEKNAPIIIKKIENNLKLYNQFKKIKISLSIGYEVLKPDKSGHYDLYKTLKKADKRMYEEKRR